MQRNWNSLGIVVELENIEASGDDRALVNLRELDRQIQALGNRLPTPVSFLVVYDSKSFAKADAQRFIIESGLGENPSVASQTIGAPNLHYYEHKNVGLAHCDSDIVILMDSDILIQDGWLGAMLDAFEKEEVAFVSGSSHIETPRLLDKIYALTDPGFPLFTHDREGVHETDLIMANAFAMRRSKLDNPLFPSIAAYRGHCAIASQELRAKGETLYRQYDAIALHPSQEDLGAYFARAFAEGCDSILLSRHVAKSSVRARLLRSGLGSVFRLLRGWGKLIHRNVKHRQLVALPALATPLSILVGMLYFSVRFAGELTTLVSADFALRHSIAKTGH